MSAKYKAVSTRSKSIRLALTEKNYLGRKERKGYIAKKESGKRFHLPRVGSPPCRGGEACVPQ